MIINDHSQRTRGQADGVRYTGGDPVYTVRCNQKLVDRVIALRTVARDEADAQEVRAV